MKILILCTGNSCRSQMAEGFLKNLDKRLTVYSAGTHPAKTVNPKSVLVMQEKAIDISHHTPDNIDLYLHDFFDYVITVCDDAKEKCPVFTGKVNKRLHIPFEDPYMAKGTEEQVLN
ncbi:MAG: protein tyrosine phosphatase, partial [Marinilabiliales bacterium]